MLKIKAETIDEFIAAFPAPVQKKLEQMRGAISKAAPGSTQAIKYGIPTFVLNGNLVHFSGYDHHIGFYPGAGGVMEFKKELSAFETAKGTVRFPLDKPLPLLLIAKIVKFRVAQNLAKKSKTSPKASKRTKVKPSKARPSRASS